MALFFQDLRGGFFVATHTVVFVAAPVVGHHFQQVRIQFLLLIASCLKREN